MIERLAARGVAYVAEDHVLFSPSAMDALPGVPRYGSLAQALARRDAGRRPRRRRALQARSRWISCCGNPPRRTSRDGRAPAASRPLGRPGWHIECSAMSMAKLLQPFGGGLACDDPAKNVFDIHGGGIDLVFPHHENEIAQSCCAFGAPRMANVWMHNGFLQVEGEKMSKSLGNFVTIHELLRTTHSAAAQWSGEVLRLAMLRTHYRQPIDWTVKALEEAEATLDRWYDAVGDVEPGGEIAPGVEEALCDDLNTPAALAELHRLGRPAVLKASANLLGLLRQTKSQRLASALDEAAVDPAWVAKIVAERAAARAGKNWKESDRLRDELARLGVVLNDSKDGTTWEFKR